MRGRLLLFLGIVLGIWVCVFGYAFATHQLPIPDFESLAPHEDPFVSTRSPASTEATTTVTSTHPTNAFVIHGVDGDTIAVRLDGDEKEEAHVRLLGINTPESVDPRRPVECFGKEASTFVKNLVAGKRVLLEADPEADDRDKYARLLRVVYLDDGRNLNKLLVSEGYAYAYVSFPMNALYKRELKKLEEDAKLQGRGLWSPETCAGRK
jgi:micrococcal nuclease